MDKNGTTVHERKPDLIRATLTSIRIARARGETWGAIVLRARHALREGPVAFARRVIAFSKQSPSAPGPAATTDLAPPTRYEKWLTSASSIRTAVLSKPRISVVLPTWNTPELFLRETIESVKAQTFSNWQLCIADDASDQPHVGELIRAIARDDPRICFTRRQHRGGISAASNDALALVSGEYVAFLDHDDVLAPDALASVASKILETDADIVYTDHDLISEDGRYWGPFFKPDWSPDLFLAQMYLGHLIVVRSELLRTVGPFRPEYDGSQDYDMVLRCAQAGARMAHVAKVLYHWRQHSGSTSTNPGSKPYAHSAGKRAIQDYLDIAQPGAHVEDGDYMFCYDVRYPLPRPAPMVSVIILAKDRLDRISTCVRSILECTDYDSYELLILDNGSAEPNVLSSMQSLAHQDRRVRIVSAPMPFDWSRLNNLGATRASGQVLIFLNDDTEVLSRDWMRRLAENALRPGIGACGPLLLYGDGTIQHAGVVVGLGGYADHVFKGSQAVHDQRLFVSPVMRRNVLAVTGACMAIAAETFGSLGGFDDSFACGSDVAICLRGHRQGLWNLYLPEVRLIRHESKTRVAYDLPAVDFIRSAEEYGRFRIEGDPLYNPNLDLMSLIPELGSPH